MLTSCWQDWDGIPGDEQQTCSKHVEAYYWNRLIENHASCWFIVYGYNRDYILSQSKHHIPWIIIFFPAMKILEAHLTLNKVMINLWATKNESCFRELQADKKLYPSFSSSLFVRHEQVTYLHGRKISKHLRHFTTHSHSTPFYHTLTLTHTLLHFITHSPWLTLYFILSHTHPDSHSTPFYHTLTLTHTLLHFITHSPWLTFYSILPHTHPDSHSTSFAPNSALWPFILFQHPTLTAQKLTKLHICFQTLMSAHWFGLKNIFHPLYYSLSRTITIS